MLTTIQRNIRDLRDERDLTLDELAAACGIDRTTVSKWINGVASPSHRILEPLAKALGVTVADLFTRARRKSA